MASRRPRTRVVFEDASRELYEMVVPCARGSRSHEFRVRNYRWDQSRCTTKMII